MSDNYRIEELKGLKDYKIDTNGVVYGRNGKELSGSIVAGGYKRVTLHIDGVCCHKLVHRLVADQFMNCSDNDIVRHKDGNPLNNSVDNLIVDHSEFGSSLTKSSKCGRTVKAVGIDQSLYFQSIKKAGEFIKNEGKSISDKVASGNIRRSLKFGYNAYGYRWEFVKAC